MSPRFDEGRPTIGLQRPGPAILGSMGVLFAVWLFFAVAINWGGMSPHIFSLLCGNEQRILDGEVWRLFTAPLLHAPSGTIGHILFALLGLFFLAPTLEARWGAARMVRFLLLSGLIAYGFQFVALLVLPASIAGRLAPEYWYGAFPVIEAIAIAWACTFRGQTVRLFFVLPITSTGLIVMVVAVSVLRVIANAQSPEGLIAPFGGMAAGWLLGASTPSPLRRFYLRLRLAQLDREAAQRSGARRKAVKQSSLRVIEGGRGRSRENGGNDGSSGNMLH